MSVRRTRGCPSGGHKEKINKKTQLEEKTEREYISSPDEEENSLPKKIKEEKLRKKMGEAANKRVISDFSIEKYVSGVNNIFQEILQC